MIDPEKFQADVMKWNLHNFPLGGANKHWALLGVVEELGELREALNDLAAKNPDENNPKIKDAIADAMIFLAAFCGFNGLNLYMCASTWADYSDTMISTQDELEKDLPVLAGKLCHHFLKGEQKIRGKHHADGMGECVGKLSSTLSSIAQGFGWHILDCIDEVWAEVSKRDWIKYPKNGMSDEPIAPKRQPLDQTRKPSTPGKFKLTIVPKDRKPEGIPKEKWSEEVDF